MIEPYLQEAQQLVNDPKDAPYVALALFLRKSEPKVIILTFNKKDFKLELLQAKHIHVLSPDEL